MRTTITQKPISHEDTKRLEDYFFTPTSVPKDNFFKKLKKNNQLIAIIAAILLIGIITTLVILNYNIFIIPQSRILADTQSLNLLNGKQAENIDFTNPLNNARFSKNTIYMDLIPNQKNSFRLNLNKPIDITQSQLLLTLTNPPQNLDLSVVVRDKNFFSNAKEPQNFLINESGTESGFVKIPLKIKDNPAFRTNLAAIEQLRFTFQYKGKKTVPILIKSIIVKKNKK